MSTGRLEAFSDGVIAILITIMVLELHVPHHADLAALEPLVPVLLCYALSFIFVGIYWNNHHHLLKSTERTNGTIQWANLHLLFWLSLVPFATEWLGENHAAPVPTAAYGVVQLCAAVAYYLLQLAIIADQGPHSPVAAAIGADAKGKASPLLCLAAIPLAFVSSWIAIGLYVVVAGMWLVPDRRLVRRTSQSDD